jgi:hypothetical protein
MQKRKLIYLICFYFLVLSLLGGCEKQSLQMGVAEKTGIQRAKGVPAGAPVTRQIDVAGGTIFSDDGRTELIIPPGALSDPITISIQTINSTLPLSLAGAYRLEPNGLQFEQPVTIRIHYTDEQVANSSPEILFIGYQDPSDVWRALKDSHVDMDSKTISASISHFSDWTVFEEYSLSASSNAVSPGETSNLHVIRNGFLDGDAFEYILSDTSSNWLAPLDDMGKVENWQLLGQGSAGHPEGGNHASTAISELCRACRRDPSAGRAAGAGLGTGGVEARGAGGGGAGTFARALGSRRRIAIFARGIVRRMYVPYMAPSEMYVGWYAIVHGYCR